jgi:hypothetical protein
MEKEKSMKHLLLVVIAVVLLAGCSTPVRQIEISAKPIDKPELVLPPIEQLRLKDVEWVVINQENAKEVFAQLLEDKKDPVLIGLTDDGYEILSLNYSDIMSHIQQQNAIIKAYRNYYEESEQALENANSQIEGAQAEVEEQNNAPKESTLDKLNPFK